MHQNDHQLVTTTAQQSHIVQAGALEEMAFRVEPLQVPDGAADGTLSVEFLGYRSTGAQSGRGKQTVQLDEAVIGGTASQGRKADGTENLRCEYCAYTCLSAEMMSRHMMFRHKHMDGGGRYQCHLCSYSTDRSSHLKNHQLVHSGERPFPCDRCSKAFTRKYFLKLHVSRVHLNLKPHVCKECGKSFTCVGDLERHERIHSNTVVVRCEVCGKQFTDRSVYLRHVKSKRLHGKK